MKRKEINDGSPSSLHEQTFRQLLKTISPLLVKIVLNLKRDLNLKNSKLKNKKKNLN